MLGAGVASVDNVLDVEVIILGGGLGVRLGQPYADRIAAAMAPHLFFSDRPPPVARRRARRPRRRDRREPAARVRSPSRPDRLLRARSSPSGTSANFSACSVAGSVSIPRAASTAQMRSQASRRAPVGGRLRRIVMSTDSSSAASLSRAQRTLTTPAVGRRSARRRR